MICASFTSHIIFHLVFSWEKQGAPHHVHQNLVQLQTGSSSFLIGRQWGTRLETPFFWSQGSLLSPTTYRTWMFYSSSFVLPRASSLKHRSEYKTKSPKQIQKREPEAEIWIEIPEMEEETKRDIVHPWQSEQNEPSIKWYPLSYWDPGVPTSGVAKRVLKSNTKMRVSHVKINKYQRRVTQYHTHIWANSQYP